MNNSLKKLRQEQELRNNKIKNQLKKIKQEDRLITILSILLISMFSILI